MTLFEPLKIPMEYSLPISLILFSMWVMPIIFLIRKSIKIAEYCKQHNIDEFNLIFSKHSLALSWWRSLLAWIGITILWW